MTEGTDDIMERVRLPFAGSAELATLRLAAQRLIAGRHRPELVEDTLLVITELVENVIQHTPDGGELAVTCRAASVRVEVADRSRHLPEPQQPDARRIGGRGLLLVAAMSIGWGSTPTAEGKVVWAELSATA